MSGTSLDGLDLADVKFSRDDNGNWSFDLISAETITYTSELRERIFQAPKLSAEKISLLSVELSQFYADQINQFISTNHIDRKDIYAISSHGQTIFHQPERSLTLQIGNTPHIAIQTGIKSVVDFRTKDVALGGNGAPLIPIVDHLLFKNKAQGYLNLGGFSNLSFTNDGVVRSFDVGPANIVINYLVSQQGLTMDEDGRIAASGKLNQELLSSLNKLEYYTKEGPKSLGWEWVEKAVLPMFNNDLSIEDKLHTYVFHITGQLNIAFKKANISSVMITGGGAHNSFLIDQLTNKYAGEIVIPSKEIVDFKEAIGFAFLGLLRCLNETNVLSSVTGARKDSCSGVIYKS